jgi:tetratricopeptide (TPR) repeat protein
MEGQSPRELPLPNPAAQMIERIREVAAASQKTLAENPRDAKALAAMGLVALSSGQSENAVRMAWAATEADPAMTPGWVILGQALKADGKPDVAAMAYREALQREPANPLAHAGIGELLIVAGQAEEAVRSYEQALAAQPDFVAALVGLGHSLACLNRHEEALKCYERALAVEPLLAEAEFAAGFVCERMRQLDRAERRYRKALQMNPLLAAPWINLGNILRETGREQEAEIALRRGLQLKPDSVAGWNNLSLLQRERRQYRETEQSLRKSLALKASNVETLIHWCQFRIAENDLSGAWGWLRWALAADPKHAECENMRGILLHHEGLFDEAIEAFERADAMGHRVACANRGNSLVDAGRHAEAVVALEDAARRNPQNAGAAYNLSLARLRLGDWRRGWPEYEARWRFREVHRRPRVFEKPRWRGETLEGQRVLLHAEQGLGDTIQFCRYAALVAERGGFPILEVQKPVERLMRSLEVVRSGRAEVTLLGETRAPHDFECPLMSLPAVFGTIIETTPWAGPYLAADPALVAQRLVQFPELAERAAGQPLRVGVAWAGNPGYRNDQHRSVRLSRLLPLFSVKGVEYFALQKGAAAEQLAFLPPRFRVCDGSSQETDLAETAALVAQLDLVITTDTSIVHLAGALGKPLWVLLPYFCDWRWMLDRPTTPWYPTARLLRQRAQGDWDELFARAARDLKALLKQRRESV